MAESGKPVVGEKIHAKDVTDELDKKAIIRNAIILVSVLVVIAVIITILFNIW